MNGSNSTLGEYIPIQVQVNGVKIASTVEPRQHLADFLRIELGLKGTRVGCEQGHCGACTVDIGGESVRACLTLAVQVNNKVVLTIEGLSQDPVGRTLQEFFTTYNASQCGFCTAGMIISARELLLQYLKPSRQQIRDHLSGNYCRCTGYESIINAVFAAAESLNTRAGNNV